MTCPVCHKPTQPDVRPFCSKRCADLDLGKWFSDSYALPSEEPLDEEAAEAIIRHYTQAEEE